MVSGCAWMDLAPCRVLLLDRRLAFVMHQACGTLRADAAVDGLIRRRPEDRAGRWWTPVTGCVHKGELETTNRGFHRPDIGRIDVDGGEVAPPKVPGRSSPGHRQCEACRLVCD